ncbi:MAG: M90 family metallopeptidase [Planctomycetota bacterium]
MDRNPLTTSSTLIASTNPGVTALALAILALAGAVVFFWARKRVKKARRADFRSRPFPEPWVEILNKNLSGYAAMPEDLKAQLHEHIHVFLGEKEFEGCGGLTLTPEIRVTIAAQACMLLMNRETDYYPKLTTVLVYPSTFFARNVNNRDGMVEEVSERAGEAWDSGPVVISWDDFVRGIRRPWRPMNVISHEFAHRLDFEDGAADGAPVLESRTSYSQWAEVLEKEYETLRRKTGRSRRTLLDKYGATDPAEFFAVVTEAFFEMPARLKKKHPELYEEFRKFYALDPAAWWEPDTDGN